MRESIVLTVIAQDKPGVVELLSKTVAAFEANWEESSMARLAGKFAGILAVEVPRHRSEDLRAALVGLKEHGLTVVVERAADEGKGAASKMMRLELVGHDREGIVKEISRALAAQGVNVERLETQRVSAPMSAELLFKARALLCAPGETTVADLRTTLEDIAHDLMVELQLDEG